MSITFTDLIVNMPFAIKQIKDITIMEKVNEHSIAEMVCIMDDTKDVDLLYQMTIKDMVKIEYKKEESLKTLFAGYPIKIDIEVTGGIYYLHLRLADATVLMDFKKKTRSFQDKSKPFSQVVRTIFRQEYAGLCYFIGEDISQNKVMIQYEETDWEYIKRVASHWNLPIVTNAREGRPTVFLGVPNGEIYDEAHHNFTIKNEVACYLHDNANVGRFMRMEYISYEIESGRDYGLGDRIRYNKIEFIIFEKTASIDKGELKFRYSLKVEEGIRQNLIIHKELQGSSFIGKVIDRKEDFLKVHLLMDKEQSLSEATWFQLNTAYSAEGNTGVYIMPEIGELVSLYLPEYNEDKGFIKYSIREQGGAKPHGPDT